MLVKNLIFYQNLNRSLKYQAKSPFKMYKKRIQRPDFTKLSSVILPQPWTTRFTRRYCILSDLYPPYNSVHSKEGPRFSQGSQNTQKLLFALSEIRCLLINICT